MFRYIGAITARILFILHTVSAAVYMSVKFKNMLYVVRAAPALILVVELIVSWCVSKFNEPKWFCPSAFLFTICELPIIIVLMLEEFTLFDQKSNNERSELSTILNQKKLDDTLDETLAELEVFFYQIENILRIDDGVSVVNDTFLISLVIGRWLLPTPKLTTDQKANLLMLYIGLSSDIADYVSLISNNRIKRETNFRFVILVSWCLSILQFSIVITAKKTPKCEKLEKIKQKKSIDNDNDLSCVDYSKTSCCDCLCCKTEIWGCLTSIMLQDIPFLITRLMALVRFRIITFTILFFIFKNVLTILVQIYKMCGLCGNTDTKENVFIDHTKKSDEVQSEDNPAFELEYP